MTFDVTISDQQAQVTITTFHPDTLLEELVKLEKSLGEQQIPDMTVQFAGAAVATSIMDRLGYTPDAALRNRFAKRVHYQRSVRLSLTEKCNYHCFFCHEEGMDMQTQRAQASETQLFNVLNQLAELDYRDFTFTGGEPLLNQARLFSCLEHMKIIGYCPDITIVTNGVVINEDLLNRLRQYPNRFRFNVSLHSVNPDDYANIVQNMAKPEQPLRREFEKLQNNLGLLRQHQFPFKLNVVLLKDINTSNEALSALFDFAIQTGASKIKFLELMLTPDLGRLYPYFYSLQALQDRLASSLTFVDSTYRRTEYRYQNSDLLLELQQCTCSRGCNTCAVNRATNFTAELKSYPCFLKPDQNFDLTRIDLKTALHEGDRMIEHMAKHYGDHSPIIIQPAYSTEQETFYYYEITAADLARLEQEWQLKNHLRRARHFEEQYYSISHGDPEPHDSRINKVSLNSYDHSHLKIQQIIQTHPDEPGAFTTRFLHRGESTTASNLPVMLTLHWHIQYYELPQDIIQEQSEIPHKLSISTNIESSIHLIQTIKPLKLSFVTLKPLTSPPFEWVRYRQRIL